MSRTTQWNLVIGGLLSLAVGAALVTAFGMGRNHANQRAAIRREQVPA